MVRHQRLAKEMKLLPAGAEIQEVRDAPSQGRLWHWCWSYGRAGRRSDYHELSRSLSVTRSVFASSPASQLKDRPSKVPGPTWYSAPARLIRMNNGPLHFLAGRLVRRTALLRDRAAKLCLVSYALFSTLRRTDRVVVTSLVDVSVRRRRQRLAPPEVASRAE
jgi:hypothetical protein